MAGRAPPTRMVSFGGRREWEEEVPAGDSRSPSRQGLRRPSRLVERDRDRTSRSRSPLRRVIIPGRSPSPRGRGRAQGRAEIRGALPRRRASQTDGDGGWGRRGSGLTLTPAAGAKRHGNSEEKFGPGRRDRKDKEEEDGKKLDPERRKKYRLRLEDWILAVNLLLSWDDQKTTSAADMEAFLSRFLEYDAKVKYRITPRLTSEIFLRGMLRTLWDIDRLLRVMNPGDELKTITAKSPLVLSILRVMAYEFMWTPSCTARGAKEGARDLMDRVSLSAKADRDWITEAMIRMGGAFEKAHNDWDKKHAAAKERKRRERADQAAAAAGAGDLAAGGAKIKLAENAKAKARRREGDDGKNVKRKGADAHFGNATAIAVKQQALARKADQSDAQKPTRAAVVQPAAAQEEGEEDEEGDEGGQGHDAKAEGENSQVIGQDERVEDEKGEEEEETCEKEDAEDEEAEADEAEEKGGENDGNDPDDDGNQDDKAEREAEEADPEEAEVEDTKGRSDNAAGEEETKEAEAC